MNAPKDLALKDTKLEKETGIAVAVYNRSLRGIGRKIETAEECSLEIREMSGASDEIFGLKKGWQRFTQRKQNTI